MHRRVSLSLFLILIFGFVSFTNLFSQDKWWKEKKYKNENLKIKYDLCKKTFKDIGNGFTYKNINYINQYFDSQVYLNITRNDRGYYSSSQAEQILLDFMDNFAISNFKYFRSSSYNTYAFVNGVYSYIIGSGRRDLKVAISLKYHDSKWYVDQISIN